MKKSIFLFFALVAGALNLFAQDDCVKVETTFEGTASITFVRYPHKEMPGLFTVNASGDLVRFAQGNLQYRASTNVWRFAENQWDAVRSDNKNVSDTYDGWIDLFCWGTSGYNNGAAEYQPYSTSSADADYYGDNVSDTESDWAWHNVIINGGNEYGPKAHQWRVLTSNEWKYIFSTRANADQLWGFGKLMKINEAAVQGVYLLPDSWNWETVDPGETLRTAAGFTWTPNTKNFNSMQISANGAGVALWTAMEAAGAVFLPAGGYRRGTGTENGASHGYYWSATSQSATQAYIVRFYNGTFNNGSRITGKGDGRSIRPVQDMDE